MKNKGFTLPEVLIMVVILSLATGVFIKWLTYKNTLQVSKAYSDQTKAYTNIFIGYLKKNQKSILNTISPSNPIVVSWNDLLNQGYVPTGIGQRNLFNQRPCLLITQNQGSNLLYPIMVYSDGNGVNATVTNRAMAILGGMSAVYNRTTDSIVGDYGLWGYSSFFNTYQGVLNRCGNKISDGSLAMNIGMDNDFNDAITPDVSLHRVTDTYFVLGESSNTNTTFTDITLTKQGNTASGKLYFNHNRNVYFSQDNLSNTTVTLKNGSLTAQALQPIVKNNPGLACNASQLGGVSAQIDGLYGMQSSVLVCSYNPPVCQAQAGSDYCYTPIKHNTIKYTNTGYMGTTFMCPAGAPIVSDAVANTTYANIQYRECEGFLVQYDCSKGNIQNKQVSNGSSGQAITTPINVSGTNFYMQVGYKATNNLPDLSTCANQCSALKMSQHNSSALPKIINATCACDSGSFMQPNFRIVNVMSVSPVGTPSINYVTCTSKMILTQQ